MKEIGVSIVGGTGYGAGELLRLFVGHPSVEVVSVVSSSHAGKRISENHPHLRGFYGQCFDDSLELKKLEEFPKKVIFFALPHGTSVAAIASVAEECSQKNISIIDLSGDFRLKDEKLHSEYYHASPFEGVLREKFVYGAPEIKKEALQRASFVSNPGCLATASILSLAPIAGHASFVPFVITAATGSSGSGKEPKATTHHPIRHANLVAYKPLSHQHEPEIVQTLSELAGKEINISFTPQSLPVSRGIFVSANAVLKEKIDRNELLETYRRFYRGAPFIRVLDETSPELQNVIGSNFCDLCIHARGTNVVVLAALDNLVKGMAGQAIQNMNIICGLSETSGLWNPALRPC